MIEINIDITLAILSDSKNLQRVITIQQEDRQKQKESEYFGKH